MVKLGKGSRVPAPRSHVRVTTARPTNRTLPGVVLFDQDAFTPGESARLAAFFDAIPTFKLLPDEDTQP